MAKPHQRPKRPTDPIQLAKLVGDIATGQAEEQVLEPSKDELRRVMSMLGKIGGPRGGKARAKSLTPERREAIARKAAKSRWKKRK